MFLIAQKKRRDALNATQKKPSSVQSTVSEKNPENPHKIPIFNQNGQKIVIFGGFS